MDQWLKIELHARRNELLASARQARLIRLAESGRGRSVRGRIADSAQRLSNLLAVFAQAVR